MTVAKKSSRSKTFAAKVCKRNPVVVEKTYGDEAYLAEQIRLGFAVRSRDCTRELVIDSFAGKGGASLGIEMILESLGKLAEIRDSGIPIYFFVGNHDLWMHDYFETELNIPVYHDNQEYTFGGKTFLIGHGDGLGPGDKGYKRMKKVFTNPFSKWLFRWLHPDLGVKLAQYLSVKNKLISGDADVKFLGEENEWLVLYSKRKLETKHYDYFVFGHRHLPMQIKVGENSTYINLGDWIGYFTYGVFDGETFELKEYKQN